MPDWQCPRCNVTLGEVFGLTASCPECLRAYTCITEEEYARTKARRKNHKIKHGAPLPTKYVEKEVSKMFKDELQEDSGLPVHKAFAAWIEYPSGMTQFYTGRTGHFQTAKACLRSCKGRFDSCKVTVIEADIVWREAEVQSL